MSNCVTITVCSSPAGGGGEFDDTNETVTIVAGTGVADPTVFLTKIISDGSAGTQSITIDTIDPAVHAGRYHLLYFQTATDPADVVTFAAGETITLIETGFVLCQLDAGGNWHAWTFGPGATTDITDDRFFTRGANGNQDWTLPPLYFTSFEFIDLAVTTDANPEKYRTAITSDGSAGAQSIDIAGEAIDLAGAPHLFRFSSETDPADTITITSTTPGIVGNEVITLPTQGAWATLVMTKDGWLPWTFGGGATTDAVGNRTLQLTDTGGLSWV